MTNLTSLAFPNAVIVVMDMLSDIAPCRTAVGPNFTPDMQLITVRRVGGSPDLDDVTDYPVVQVACYAPTYPAASALADQVQIRILTSPCTAVNGVLVDEARIFVGEQEVPDVYPDDRRIVSTYQLGWRRQFQP